MIETAARSLAVAALLAAGLLGAWVAWACHRAQRRGLPGADARVWAGLAMVFLLLSEAKLARGSAAPQSIQTPAPDVKAFAAAAGSVYTIALPPNLEPGEYRLMVETTLGREKASREMTFRVVGG